MSAEHAPHANFRQAGYPCDTLGNKAHRLAGVAGLFGALLFFAGDMLFYGHFGAGDQFPAGALATIQHSSPDRLFLGGLIGPLAACLCILGFWHVYLNVQLEEKILGRLMLAAFVAMMVAGSAVHTLWVAKGIGMKYCGFANSDCGNVLVLMRSYWSLAYDLSAVPGYVGAVLLGYLVILRKTIYPRWTVTANPAVLIFLSMAAVYLPAPIGAIVVGGSANLSIAAFFAVSLWTTRSREPPMTSSASAVVGQSKKDEHT